jgi:hypothetical protein
MVSLAIVSFFMEDFNRGALNTAVYKHCCWFWYADNTFMIWPHGPGKLSDFFDCFKSYTVTSNSPQKLRKIATSPSCY